MKVSKVLFVLALVALLGTAAWADTLTENCTIVSSAVELSSSISCAQFNVAGATLTNISILLTGTITGTITVANTSGTNVTVNSSTSTAFSFGSLTGFTYSNPLFSASFAVPANTVVCPTSGGGGGGGGCVSPAVPTPYTFNGSNTHTGTIATTNVAGYSGASTFLIPVTTVTSLSDSSSGGNASFTHTTNGQATAQVTFTYTTGGATPEPTTTSLIGCGILALGFVARRLRQ